MSLTSAVGSTHSEDTSDKELICKYVVDTAIALEALETLKARGEDLPDEAFIYQKFHEKAVFGMERQGINEDQYKAMVDKLRDDKRHEISEPLEEAKWNYNKVKEYSRSIKDTTDSFALDDLALYGKSPGTCDICRITSN